MAAIRLALAFLAAILFTSAAQAGEKVILGFGASPSMTGMEYTLRFRSQDGRHFAFTNYVQNHPMFATKRDFNDSNENGFVKILSLPPGDWKIDGVGYTEWPAAYASREEVDIPFTVNARTATYIGDYEAVRSASGGIVFLVSDKSARDIPIAKGKVPGIADVTIAIPFEAAQESPYFTASMPPLASVDVHRPQPAQADPPPTGQR